MDYFGLQTRSLREGVEEERRRRGRRRRGRRRSKVKVWNYECLNGTLKFYVKVHAIVWLGACPKPRVVRISS